MEKLGLDYLDLYLIHWPAAANRFDNWEDINGQTWRAMTELYQQGRVRAIGVSNFLPHHLEPLLKTEVAPMVNQVECNPGCQQKQTLAYCRDHGILVEAWSPLGSGRVLENATLQALGKQYGKSAAQICLRWCLEQGVLPLPKSVTPQRIQENTAIFDFALTPEDMARIAALPPFGGSGHDPDQIAFNALTAREGRRRRCSDEKRRRRSGRNTSSPCERACCFGCRGALPGWMSMWITV